MFQNHYGWIETYGGKVLESRFFLFQNHYGWIETGVSLLPVSRMK